MIKAFYLIIMVNGEIEVFICWLVFAQRGKGGEAIPRKKGVVTEKSQLYNFANFFIFTSYLYRIYENVKQNFHWGSRKNIGRYNKNRPNLGFSRQNS
ncbi:MAG: hypothetical protein NT121_10530, partial [Chloroflexi bacterium]|nr:hypothetical protein [Chloroflexota bacterium]